MKIVACVNAIALSEYATMALADGMTTIDRVAARLDALASREAVSLIQTVVFTDDANPALRLPGSWRVVKRPRWSVETLCGELAAVGSSGVSPSGAPDNSDGIAGVMLYLHADSPLFGVQLAAQLLEVHRRYAAEYAFADGYPVGVGVEVLSTAILPAIKRLAEGEMRGCARLDLFEIINKDINAFDIETELSPVDLRMLRLSLTCDTRRNFTLCRRLIDAGADDARGIINIIQKHPQLLRTLPAYAAIEVVDADGQQIIHSPAPILRKKRGPREEMSPETFRAILAQLTECADDMMVEISLWGEVGLHSRVIELLELLGEFPSLSPLVQTSGVGWGAKAMDAVASGRFNAFEWVLNLDADDETLYRAIRGEGFAESRAFADMLLNTAHEKTHIQAVRMKENEEHLRDFYQQWKERTPRVIIQKYDHFCGLLPDRQVTDISPLKRLPCWHIKRDINILIDGTVPLCREDILMEHTLGNVLVDGVKAVWHAGEHYYARHTAEEYPDLCKRCDEYYTYNH